MAEPLISIIVPVYNVAPFVEQSLESIRQQSYTNFEVIIVDDGSTDNSGVLCDSFCQQDSRFRVIHQKNQWLSGARNTGLKEAQGEWICFIDSDDFVEQDYLMALYNKAQEGYLVSMVDFFYYPYGSNQQQEGIINDKEDLSSEDIFRKLFPINDDSSIKEKVYFSVVWNKLYHKSVLESLCFKPLPAGEDKEFNLHVYLRIKKAGIISRPLYYYRQRSSGIMGTLSADQILDYRRILLFDELLTNFCFPESCLSCRTWLLRNAFSYMISMRLKAWPSKLDSTIRRSCRSMIQNNGREFLTCQQIPLKQKIAFPLFWYFPKIGRAIAHLP